MLAVGERGNGLGDGCRLLEALRRPDYLAAEAKLRADC